MDRHYEATASAGLGSGELTYCFSLDLEPIRDAKGQDVGSASVFSYVADVPDHQRVRRPVIFAFNGGPGSASVYLHFGGIGPKRANIPVDLGQGINPPYGLEESVDSLLSVADLVFIDPVNTGYGRFLPDAETGDCYSIEGDARYFADLIRNWVARQDRWDSPKYIVGESYGTQRAAFLANALLRRAAVPLDGIILISQCVNIQEVWDRPGNVAGAIANLPTKAATAWYHGLALKGLATVDEAVSAAIDFAYSDFAVAMMKGNLLREEEKAAFAERLEHFTGFSANKYLRNRFWVNNREFCDELFVESGRVLGRYDSRYVAPAATSALCEVGIEPTDLHITPRFAAVATRYLSNTFNISLDHEYRMHDHGADHVWEFTDSAATDYASPGQPSPFAVYPYPARLSQYLKQVPEARLFIATGHYDTLTTVGAVEHLLRQFDLPLDRVTSKRYPAGHMMYTDPVSCEQLTRDLRAFLTCESPGR